MNRVLLLSSNQVLKQKNTETLTAHGFVVTEAADAFHGLILAEGNLFAAIIIDEELGDIDGYRASQKIREYSAAPIILFGTEASDKIWTNADKLGFDIYLRKPINPREFISYLKALLRRTQSPKPYQSQKSKEIRSAVSPPDIGQSQIKNVVIPQKSDDVETSITSPFTADEAGQPLKIESMTASEMLNSISSETPPPKSATEHDESIEEIVAGMERQIHKIKRSIDKFSQVQKTIGELKVAVHHQQQGLVILENKLQEISKQLEDISRNPD